MKIIVCGAGSVGRSIVGYLTQGNNDIIVIDNNEDNLDFISKEWDIQPIFGSCSNPTVLERAGAAEADLFLAVTDTDEVNMVSCQIAHSIFNIPQKIARINDEIFSDPKWGHLYNDDNIPIDKLISPDIAIADAIFSILKIPGTTSVMPFIEEKLFLVSIKCSKSFPFIKTPLMQMSRIAPELDISIVSIVRSSKSFIPTDEDIFEINDEIYFLVKAENIEETMQIFGASKPSNEKVIIFGGGQISKYLAEKIEKDDNFTTCTIIEEDEKEASRLAEDLSESIIIKGEMMSDVILQEAGINKADVTIAVTLRDKDNILASLLAKKRGVPSSLSLVNSRSYGNMIDNIGDNILIDRSSVTISSILKELRKSKIIESYALGRGFGEVWELKIEEDGPNANKKISELKLPINSKVCTIYRNDKLIFPNVSEKLLKDDIIIVFVGVSDIKKIEMIFL